MIQRVMSAEEFAANRADLPDAGQWAELIRGVPVTLQPPDIDHGTVVLNFSKALAAYVQLQEAGYACFDLGLRVERRPDTIFFPAISYFTEGERFAEADKDYTDAVPPLVVELLSTPDRRKTINERTGIYINRGIRMVWVIDPLQRVVHVVEKGSPHARRLSEFETLTGEPVLQEFSVRVQELFVEPEWVK